jgi:hypothetical protein
MRRKWKLAAACAAKLVTIECHGMPSQKAADEVT